MIGEEGDHGRSIFHNQPLVGSMVIGGLDLGAMPEAFGPRNWGQLEPAPAAVEAVSTSARRLAANRNVIFCFKLVVRSKARFTSTAEAICRACYGARVSEPQQVQIDCGRHIATSALSVPQYCGWKSRGPAEAQSQAMPGYFRCRAGFIFG